MNLENDDRYTEGEIDMFTLIFLILMFMIFGKLLVFAIKAAWGITKIIWTIVVLPIALIALVACGLIYIAVPVLAIVGIVSLCCTKKA